MLIIGILYSCTTNKEIVYGAPVEFEQEILDTLVVSASSFVPEEDNMDYPLPKYNPEATRTYDILHTKLELSFNWALQHVIGKAHIDITPLFYPIKNVTLDAKQFIINEVRLGRDGEELRYD